MEYSVVVVEDEVLIRFVAVDSLEDEGWTVYEAGSVLEAVGMLSSHPEIDVVFTDVDMPGGMSGLDLARLIANIHPEIGIIVTSGRYYAAENDLRRGRWSNANRRPGHGGEIRHLPSYGLSSPPAIASRHRPGHQDGLHPAIHNLATHRKSGRCRLASWDYRLRQHPKHQSPKVPEPKRR